MSFFSNIHFLKNLLGGFNDNFKCISNIYNIYISYNQNELIISDSLTTNIFGKNEKKNVIKMGEYLSNQ